MKIQLKYIIAILVLLIAVVLGSIGLYKYLSDKAASATSNVSMPPEPPRSSKIDIPDIQSPSGSSALPSSMLPSGSNV